MLPIPLIFGTGWASGINCYAAVLMLGLLGRFAHVAAAPPVLGKTDVLVVAGVAFACQFAVGKIPLLDSLWDIAHTVVRPVVGGALGVLLAQHAHAAGARLPAAAFLAAGTALTTHVVKTGIRLGVNVSPEPVSNIIASLLEDAVVVALIPAAVLHPVPTAVILGFALVLGLLLVVLLAGRIQRAWLSRREWQQQRRALAR